MSQVSISIIITSYNDSLALLNMLKSLRFQSYFNFEVIVADDGSNDNSIDLALSYRNSSDCNYPLKLIFHKHIGWRLSTVRNMGANLAEGSFLVFVDGDQICHKDILYYYSLIAQKDCGASGVRHYIDNNKSDDIVFMMNNTHIVKKDRRIEQNKIHDGFIDSIQVWGCNCAVNKFIWDRIGGFDEDFRGWGMEDRDFFTRVERSGYSIIGCPKAIVYHFMNSTNVYNKEGKYLWKSIKRYDNSIIRNDGRHNKNIIKRGEGYFECIE